MSTIRVKRGDQGVTFSDQLTAAHEPIDLTGASVFFLLREVGALYSAIASEAVIVNASEGRVTYTTGPDDLARAGVYAQEWELVYETGDRFTVPSDSYNVVRVAPDLTNPEES